MSDFVVAKGTSPVAAALVSLFVPGLGQWWLGQRRKAVLIVVSGLLLCCLFGVWNLFAAMDAWHIASKLQRGESVRPMQSTPVLDRIMQVFNELT